MSDQSYYFKVLSRASVLELLIDWRMSNIEPDLLKSYLGQYIWDGTVPNISDYSVEEIRDCIKQEILNEYGGCRNGFLAELYQAITGRRVKVTGVSAKRYTCLCCGANTLLEAPINTLDTLGDVSEISPSHEICLNCYWEHDGLTDRSVEIGMNGKTMENWYQTFKKNNQDVSISCRWEFGEYRKDS